MRRFLPRLGLRARITIAFAVGALFMSVVLAGATIGLTRRNLLDQRESAATAQTYANAQNVRNQLESDVSDPLGVVSSLVTATGSNPVLLLEGTWYPLNAEFSGDSLPADLSELVQSGQPARMRFRYNDETELAVGVPLESVNGAYFATLTAPRSVVAITTKKSKPGTVNNTSAAPLSTVSTQPPK